MALNAYLWRYTILVKDNSQHKMERDEKAWLASVGRNNWKIWSQYSVNSIPFNQRLLCELPTYISKTELDFDTKFFFQDQSISIVSTHKHPTTTQTAPSKSSNQKTPGWYYQNVTTVSTHSLQPCQQNQQQPRLPHHHAFLRPSRYMANFDFRCH